MSEDQRWLWQPLSRMRASCALLEAMANRDNGYNKSRSVLRTAI